MGVEWVSQIPSRVFSRIKNSFSKELKKQYGMKDANFSSSAYSDTPSVFPFVYMKTLQPVETATDIEASNVNGALFTFQIDVTDNASESTAIAVSNEVLRIMKKYRFESVGLPYPDTSTKGTYRIVSRYRREINENDTL